MKIWIAVLSLGLIYWLEGVFAHFPGRRERSRHAFPNLGMGLLNGGITALFFAGLIIWVIREAEVHSFGLLRQFSLGPITHSFLAFLLFDLWMYFWHRANHRIPFLWRLHRVHHSDRDLDSTSVLRFHTGEIVISSLLRLAVIPLIGMSLSHLILYECVLFPVIIFHHSQNQLETDSNYSSIFSFWDRLSGTYRKREDTRTLVYGLTYLGEKEWQTLWGLLKTPFVNVPKNK